MMAHRLGSLPSHSTVRLFSHSKDVWIHLSHLTPTVCVDDVTAIYGQLLVGVDGNQDDATVGVDGVGLQEPDLKVV